MPKPVESSPVVDPHELLQALDALPPSLEPMDIEAIDGYLCGVLLQPTSVPLARWMPTIVDVEGRSPPAGVSLAPLRDLLERRHAQLDSAIRQRQWFDPWVFEPEDDTLSPSELVSTWVTGFAMATEQFPALTAGDPPVLNEPLALLYRHLDPDDLEDADALLAEIDMLEPAETLAEAVEELVRATLLIADVSRPQPASAPPHRPATPRRRNTPGRPGAPGRPSAKPGASRKPRG